MFVHYLKKVGCRLSEAGNQADAQAALRSLATSKLDKAADKGLYHKNKAARHKRPLSAKMQSTA